jgi:uncharacterized protein
VLVTRASDGKVLFNVGVARSFGAKFRGLIGRSSLAAGDGLFFPGTNSIHMLFMRVPIDAVFVSAPRDDGSREVIRVRPRLRPWIGVVWWVRGVGRDGGVIEVAAGAAEAAGLRRGDAVRIVPA